MSSLTTAASKPTAIYTVITTRGEVYGGKSVNPSSRLKDHQRTWPGCSMVVYEWVPAGESWKPHEIAHIAALRDTFTDVLNKNNGGGGVPAGYVYPEGSYDSRRGIKHSAERVQAQSERMMGKKIALGCVRSEAHKAAISAANKGKPKNETVRLAVAESNRRRKGEKRPVVSESNRRRAKVKTS